MAPLDPLLGIWAAVTRQTLDGNNPQGWLPEQKITVDEALKAYTSSNAYGVYAEGQRGTLAVGKLADFVIHDCDDYREPAYFFGIEHAWKTFASGVEVRTR